MLFKEIFIYLFKGSHGIEPTQDWTHFLEIRFMDAGVGFYFYYNLQWIELDKVRKKVGKIGLCLQKGKIPSLLDLKDILK